MEFDSREVKRKKNLEEQEFNFAVQIFLGRVLSQIDDRVDSCESQIKAIGEVDGVVLVVIYTARDDVRWIISSRKANRTERASWHA
jgi:uncharacterized DUF497 family protein